MPDKAGKSSLKGVCSCLSAKPSELDLTALSSFAAKAVIAATYNLAYNGALLVREDVGRMLSFDGLTTVGPGTGLEFRLLFPPLVSVIDLAWKRDVPLGDAARRFLELVRENDSHNQMSMFEFN